jgi:hypothetical protein
MKTFNRILITGVMAVAMLACTSEFEETDKNPNLTTVGNVRASGMFEPLLYGSANAWLNQTWFWNNELIQFTAFTGGVTRQEHRYSIADGNWQGVWNLYTSYANNAVHMYDLSVEQDDPALQAVALTLKVLYMSNLSDMYGDIPYAEAFTANKPGGTTTPVFDSQMNAYKAMFADLEAANELYASQPVFLKPALDGMYGGSMAAWRKFNNSLYLRLLSRVSGRTEMQAGTKMTEILNAPASYPIFTSNADNATVRFSGSDPYLNQFTLTSQGEFTSSGRKLTRQLIGMTVVTDGGGAQVYIDPRLPIIGRKNPDAVTNPSNRWIGTVSGCTAEEQSIVDRGTSWLNAAVFCRADAPAWFMDYAEVKFILAEAALKGYISGGETAASEHYTEAITASLEKWAPLGQFSAVPVTISESDITTFLDSELASWDNAGNKEELIANQKFLALFWTGMEAYHEYRRTGYPELTIGDGTVFNDYTLPTRFAFPNTTIATNEKHAREALERMGGDNTMKTPVWWSKQAIEAN